MAAENFQRGDRVRWRSRNGTSVGKVKRKVTSNTQVKGHVAKATKEKPQYLVVSDAGNEAVHRPEALTLLNDRD